MRTYESTMAEVEAIAAEQRDIFAKAEPSADDKAFLLKAEGEIDALRTVANDLHIQEVTDLKAAAERAVPVTGNESSKMLEFRDMLRGMRPGEEISLVADERALTSLSGSGSYLVPQEWDSQLREYRFEKNWMRESAEIVQTASTHNMPILTANGTAAITGENTAYTNSEPTIGSAILYAYKLTNKALVAEELLEDEVYNLEGALAKSMGYSFGLAELGYCMTGNGSSQPTGIFNKTTDLTTASSGVITNDELISAVYGLAAEYRDANCVWMGDSTTALYIAQKKVDVATSGSTPYQHLGMLNGQNMTLFGYGFKLASAIADYAAGNKVLAFGNPSEYVIGERGPIKVKRLELAEHQTTFAYAQRFDAKPKNAAAFYVVTAKA